MKSRTTIAFAGAILGIALGANAAALPQPNIENGVTYLNGGVGQDQAAAMKAEAKNYPMSMIFAAGRDNEFLANVNVTIKDQHGKELLSRAAGPIMLVKVPPGTYTVTAERKGAKLHRSVQVGGKGDKQVVFHWPKA